jgi:hypothetical protein
MAEATIDIAGAARATGLSVKALRGRVERGSLPATLIDGRRRIPVRALVEAGLLVTDRSAARRSGQKAEVDVTALLDRLERQAEEIGRLRAEIATLSLKPESGQ